VDLSASPTPRSQVPPGESPRLTHFLGDALRVALGVAVALLSVGLADYVARHPNAQLLSALGSNPIVEYLSPSGIAGGIAHGHAQPIIVLGLLALIAVTLLRVGVTAAYFASRNERESAIVGILVTILLLLGLFVVGPLLR
jgi:uncharacterized membrane protein